MDDNEEEDMDVNKTESAADIGIAGEEDEGQADREEDEMNAQEEEGMCDKQEKGEREDEQFEGGNRECEGDDEEDKNNTVSDPKGATSWSSEELIGQGTACSEAEDTVGDSLAVVHRLLELASEPGNRPAMAREPGCAAGLALLARHGEPRVSNTALRALCFLAESTGSLELLREEQALLPALLSIRDGGAAPTEATSMAADIIDFLDGWGLGRAASSGILEECPLSALEGLAVSVDRAEGLGQGARHRTRCFLGRANRRAKTITLQINGLDDLARRTMCEEALLGVRGVISFTFQMLTQRCVLRTRADLPTEKLGLAIAATRVMSAQKVIRNEQGEEVLLSLTPEGNAAATVSLPSYLPEDDEEEGVPAAPYKAMSALGGGMGDGRQGWMTAAANFLTQNFYW
uniref:armadillo repeat-containing protein 1-like n=1 Tax=Myxine glutinosa TaxID=7769 RepID=UPI00358FD4C7